MNSKLEFDVERAQRIEKFVDMLERYTEDFDDLCDCPCSDGIMADHSPDCCTVNVRRDLAKARGDA